MRREFPGSASRVTRLLLLTLAVGSLAACSDDDDDGVPDILDPIESEIRVIHAVPDAPNVNVEASLGGIEADTFDDIAFGDVTAFKSVPEGNYDLDIEARLISGTVDALSLDSVSLDGETQYTYIAVGRLDADANVPLEVISYSRPVNEAVSDMATYRVGHLASGAPAVDIYVTAAGDPLPLDPTLSNVAYKTLTEQAVMVPPGDYQIRITAASDTTVLYDSGALTLAGGDNVFLGAVINTGTNDSPISLLVAKDGASAVRVPDADASAGLRVVHLANNAGPVDISLIPQNGAAAPIAELQGVDYSEIVPADGSSYLAVQPEIGPYDVTIVQVGLGSPAIEASDVSVTAGSAVTAVARGDAADADPALGLDLLSDTTRRLADRGQVRLGHYATEVGNVDIYVLPGNTNALSGSETPAFADVPYGAVTDYTGLAAGSYDVFVTPAGSTTVAIEVQDLTIEAGGLFTGFAYNAPTTGTPTILTLDDADL